MCHDEAVSGDAPAGDDLAGLDVGARRAITRAEVEARQLGHDRVGTEHLLLGVLASGDEGAGGADTTTVVAVLRDAGLTLSATRHKVTEAAGRPSSSPSDDSGGRLPRTARADRAIARSVRFSHEHRADAVGCEHLLLGVLDVEGTAGQVLRGLGVDVDQLRSALHATATALVARLDVADDPVTTGAAGAASRQPVRCPACASPLDDALTYRTMTASGHHVPRPVTVYSCDVCGTFLGLTQSSSTD